MVELPLDYRVTMPANTLSPSGATRSGLRISLLASLLLSQACSSASTTPSTEPIASAGGQSGAGTAGAEAVAAAGTSAGSGGGDGLAVAGAAGAGGTPSNAGGGGTGGLGMTGGAGAGGSDNGVAGAGTMGVQADPGNTDDGTFDQGPGPYAAPAETEMLLNGAPAGTLSEPMVYRDSTLFAGLNFRYWIYVPAQYEAGKPAALMVHLDARHYNGLDDGNYNAAMVFDNLIHAGDLPVTIALLIDPGVEQEDGVYTEDGQNQQLRGQQYDTPSDKLANFLADEIIPEAVLPNYDIVQDPEGWGITGQSSGGISALMVGWYRPDKFRKLLTNNASFPNTGGVFPTVIGEEPEVKPLRIYMVSSTNDLNNFFATHNQAAEIFEAKGYHYRYLTGTATHWPPVQAVADYPASLRWLWSGYSLPWYP